jgi:hypothetical protein
VKFVVIVGWLKQSGAHYTARKSTFEPKMRDLNALCYQFAAFL